MRKSPRIRRQQPSAAQSISLDALASYEAILSLLTEQGRARSSNRKAIIIQFLQSVPGFTRILASLSSVAPAVPDTADEEWNPLSQRPHAPRPPLPQSDELGVEVSALKEAIEAFTTLAHEVMHVGVWEPFFVGHWCPKNVRQFRDFSLMAEGFCYFYTDVVVSGCVRVRFPDGEFALERLTPSNQYFHPVRAFDALEIKDRSKILDIYLEGFRGGQTQLWQSRSGNRFAAYLARQAYEFYAGSLGYLDELYVALNTFGCFGEFYRRFCAISALPSLASKDLLATKLPTKDYFSLYFTQGLQHLATLDTRDLLQVRMRRMLQTRAYYGLQVRWLLKSDCVLSKSLKSTQRQRLGVHTEKYLQRLEAGLHALAKTSARQIHEQIADADRFYETHVRTPIGRHDVWVGHRWLIAPRRGQGFISATTSVGTAARQKTTSAPRTLQIQLLKTIAFVVEDLSCRMSQSKTIADRSTLLASIAHLSRLGAACTTTNQKQLTSISRQLQEALAQQPVLATWSLPLVSVDPKENKFRELLFSYQ